MDSNKDFQWTEQLVKDMIEFGKKYNYPMSDSYNLIKDFKSSHLSGGGEGWEILSYKAPFLGEDDVIFKKTATGGFTTCSPMLYYYYNESVLKARPEASIHSVRRLSDGEVFSIGDRVRYCPLSTYGSFIIEKIWVNSIDKERCMVSNKDQSLVEIIDASLEKIKTPIPVKPVLFKDYEGNPIHENDVYYYLFKGEWPEYPYGPYWCYATKGVDRGYIKFNSKEKMQEYITLNKPLLSLSEVIAIIYAGHKTPDSYLRELAQSKLSLP